LHCFSSKRLFIWIIFEWAALSGVVCYNYLKIRDVRKSQLQIIPDESAKVSLLSKLCLFSSLISIHALSKCLRLCYLMLCFISENDSIVCFIPFTFPS
jgi:hypothetical protein